MSPLILMLATLASAHADEEDPAHHHHDADVRVHRVGDLAVEAALTRLGVPRVAATQVSTRWQTAIPAPERSRKEGRTDGWEFDEDRVWIRERRMDGSTADREVEAHGTWRRPEPCATLDAAPETSIVPLPLDPPVKDRGAGEELAVSSRLDMTVAERDDERLLLVDLEPGESTVVVELEPDEGTREHRRARARQRVSMSGHRVDLEIHEEPDGREVCVTLHPDPGEVRVFVERDELADKVQDILERQGVRPGSDGVVDGEEVAPPAP